MELGVAARRRRGAKGLRMPVEADVKDRVDMLNIDAHIKTLKIRREQIQISKTYRDLLKQKKAAILADH